MMFCGYDLLPCVVCIAIKKSKNISHMTKINVLIVDDSLSARGIINRGIRKFNTQTTQCMLTVMGEIDNAEDGIEFIQNVVEPINLVFLDYNLPGRNGFLLSASFPNIAYLVVSSEPGIIKMITEEKLHCQYAYMEHISDGQLFDSDDVVAAIQKWRSSQEMH